jgi:general secretion pathway protein K
MSGHQRSTRGVTLVIVLWIVAALTILVAGLVQTQRSELRLAGAARLQLLAGAAGQGAIQLAVQNLLGSAKPPDRLTRQQVAYGGRDIVVEVMPLSGLVDLNTAPEALLAALFQQAGGQDEGAARALAAAAVERRQRPPAAGQPARFEMPEELLSLPGVDHDLFARLSPLVTTDSAGSGKVNAMAAPFEVLLVLARGNAELARRIADERDAGSAAIDTTRLEGAFIDATVSTRYRFTALVLEPDGSRLAVLREIDTRFAPPGGPPWRTLRAGSRRIPAPQPVIVSALHVGG